ncbi:MAG: DinB family protein, partial [Candidatus Latescibacteria bacterium]|nr:DinB family protein [Candidatus Latescibacterota bacterium]
VHQCASEDLWFRNILGIDVKAPPLPAEETRIGFICRYEQDSANRLEVLNQTHETWWEEMTQFFDVERTRTWVMMRRIAHTAHHRGQQTTLLRMLKRDLHSTYGPTADTGGLMQNQAPTIYAYSNTQELLDGELQGGKKRSLPGPGELPPTERPDET